MRHRRPPELGQDASREAGGLVVVALGDLDQHRARLEPLDEQRADIRVGRQQPGGAVAIP